jgi:hypothetical protein
MYPWWLYALTPRDQSQPVMRVWNKYSTVVGANITLNLTWTVPDEQIAIVTAIGIDARGGGGQTPYFAFIKSDAPDNDDIYLPNTLYPDANNVAMFSQPTYFLVRPGGLITISAQFNLGAVANSLFASFAGVLIPRGSIHTV